MKLTIDLFTGLSCIISLVSSKETYLYEKQNFFGLGRRLIPKPKHVLFTIDTKGAHPKPLPSTVNPQLIFRSKSLFQGTRYPNDTRVFRRRFDFEAKLKGHQIHCEGMFECTISFLAVESTEAVPIILRGGVGYKYFTVIVKAKPGRELKGQVRAYCKREQIEDMYTEMREMRRFKFDQRVTESD